MYYAVEVQTAAGGAVNTVSFRVNKDEAAQFRSALLSAMQSAHDAPAAPAPVAQPAAPAAAPDVAAQLQQLASLRDSGILTEEEFTAKKTELLGRL